MTKLKEKSLSRNLTAKEVFAYLGIGYNQNLITDLRENYIEGWFKVGNVFLYPVEEIEKLNEDLRAERVKICSEDRKRYLKFKKGYNPKKKLKEGLFKVADQTQKAIV